MLLNDPAMLELYDDFLDKSLAYVVSSIKFLSFSTDPQFILRPDYLPCGYIAGFNRLYDQEIGILALTKKIAPDHPSPFVQSRVKHELSLLAVDAYREIFDGNDCGPGYNHKIIPVHFPLRTHFNKETEHLYHPYASKDNMRRFIDNFHGSTNPHLMRKADRMIFYADTFRGQIDWFLGKWKNLEAFNNATDENTKAIVDLATSYQDVAVQLEKYLV